MGLSTSQFNQWVGIQMKKCQPAHGEDRLDIIIENHVVPHYLELVTAHDLGFAFGTPKSAVRCSFLSCLKRKSNFPTMINVNIRGNHLLAFNCRFSFDSVHPSFESIEPRIRFSSSW